MNYLQKELYNLIKTDDGIFNFLQESALDGLWYWDLENQENEWMNEVFWKKLGYDPEKMPHKASAWQDIIFKEDLEKAIKNLESHLENPENPYDQVVRYRHAEGSVVWIRCRGLAIRDQFGKPKRLLGAHTDVTQEKEAEAKTRELLTIAQDQNKRLLNFAYIVSHNLKSHSGNISALIKLVLESTDATDKSQFFEMLTKASEQLNESVTHLSEIAEINIKSDIELKSLNLREYINKTLDSINASSISENLKVYNKVPDNICVQGFPAYLESIILNLCTNSIKYSHKSRHPEMTISAKIENERALIYFSDNGIGIDLDRHGEKIFGLYKTFHDNKDAKGVGLFLSRTQCEAMGGRIHVSSKLDEGTTFIINLKGQYLDNCTENESITLNVLSN